MAKTTVGTVPSGATHEVGLEDMFFSTTDHRGVIDQSNEVFVRNARLPREELTGRPHNIIRHPDMPGGAFKIVWDMLLAGESTGAYVLNLAGDGSAYWAMASIAPIEGGFLSVRTRPCRDDLRSAAWDLYQSATEAERVARENGASASAAAEIGAQSLTEGLAELGFTSYQSFLATMLPAEVEARTEMAGSIPKRPGAPAGLRFTLDAISDVDTRVRALGADLRQFAGDADALDGQLKATQQSLHELTAAVTEATSRAGALGDRAPLLVNAAPVVKTKCAAITAAVDEVAQTVAELASARADLSFQVAAAQLQAEMAGRFIVAVIDGSEELDTSDRAVHTLAAALRSGVSAVSAGIERNLEVSRSVRERLDGSSTTLRLLGMSLGTWRDLVTKYGVQDELEQFLPALNSTLATTKSRIAELGTTVESFGELSVTFDNKTLQTQLDKGLQLLENQA